MNGFVAWVLRQAGLDPAVYRATPANRRLPACLRVLRANDVEQARLMLQRDPALLQRAVSSILLGVTDFFRDPGVFDDLRRQIETRFPDKKGLRVLSVGCSNGAELISSAMLLDELGQISNSQLLGIDCRHEAIAHAKAGMFDPESLTGVSSRQRQRYFLPAGKSMQVAPFLRERLGWKVHDMFTPLAEANWDLIFWRNVAIFLQSHAGCLMWGNLLRALSPNGILVVGKAERPAKGVKVRRLAPCLYERKPDEP